MQAITKGSWKTTWAFFAVAVMIAVPQVEAAMQSEEPVSWLSVGMSIAVAIAGYFARDNDVPSVKAGAE